MKIFMTIAENNHTYCATIDVFPTFNLSGSSLEDIINALPDSLKNLTLNWDRETKPTDKNYLDELPYIQRIKSRGFYRSTAHRFQEFLDQSQERTLDLEYIHCLQRKEYEDFMKSLV